MKLSVKEKREIEMSTRLDQKEVKDFLMRALWRFSIMQP